MYKKTLTLALLAATSFGAFSQALPGQPAVSAKQKEIMEAMRSVDVGGVPAKARNHAQMGSNAAAMSATATLSGVTQPVSKASNADFMNLSRPGSGTPSPKPSALSSDLLIFVSLSMPEQMLMRYAAQAKRFGAVMMLRGFVNEKLSTTREVLVKLNASGAQWEISPEPFKTFKIDKVPAIVLATAESASITDEGCAKPETYTVVFGDLPVYDALDKISLLGQKEVSAMAKNRLKADREAGKKGTS